MKKLKLWSMMMLAAMTMSVMTSCGGDDGGDVGNRPVNPDNPDNPNPSGSKDAEDNPDPNAIISFKDNRVAMICIANFDLNKDNQLSYGEAALVRSLGSEFTGEAIYIFDELKYFTGLSKISDKAFDGCSCLTSITIPNSVTSIGSGAFRNCPDLTSIAVEIGNTVYDSRLNCNAIIEKSNNKLIVGCKKTIIPYSVMSIGDWAFCGCSGLTSVTIPNSVTSIGNRAFYGCSGLTSVAIGNSVTNIGSSAFYGCSGLTSVTISNSVTSIGDCAFSSCSGLISVIIGRRVNSIGGDAFSGCSSLTSVTFLCEKIGTWFQSFKTIKELVISNNVTSIDQYAFSYCSNLTSIVSQIVKPFFIYRVFGDIYAKAILYVPKGTKDSYEATPGWAYFRNVVEQ